MPKAPLNTIVSTDTVLPLVLNCALVCVSWTAADTHQQAFRLRETGIFRKLLKKVVSRLRETRTFKINCRLVYAKRDLFLENSISCTRHTHFLMDHWAEHV